MKFSAIDKFNNENDIEHIKKKKCSMDDLPIKKRKTKIEKKEASYIIFLNS